MSDDKRTYNSPLRARRAAETRQRILEAAVKKVGEGASQLTIPKVAKEAGVAVPTVYRYFPSKEDLEDGIAEHVRTMLRIRRDDGPAGLQGLVAVTRENWRRGAEAPPGTLQVMLASIARRLGDEDMGPRRDWVARALEPDLAHLPPDARARVVAVVLALASSPGFVALARQGLDPDECADTFEWVLRTLITGAEA